MTVSNFKITDISDPANLPTAYCGGMSYCDAGATGLCLAVAASGCEGAVGPDVYDTSEISTFELVDDPFLRTPCVWGYGPNGYVHQGQDTFGNFGIKHGCNALVAKEYNNFVAEFWINDLDDNGVGFDFGWKSLDDHFRVQLLSSGGWNYHDDEIYVPHFKILRRTLGAPCEGVYVDYMPDPGCYTTLAFADRYGVFHADRPEDSVTPAGECGYATEYLPYDPGRPLQDVPHSQGRPGPSDLREPALAPTSHGHGIRS